MDDTPAKENPPKDFNKLDLSQLQGFSFGTQWSQDKTSAPDQRDRSDRPRRDSMPERREGGAAPDRRDRRAFRKPSSDVSGGSPGAAQGAPSSGAPANDAPARREYSNERGPRRDYQGGPRREGFASQDRGGPRHGGYGGRSEIHDRGPYDSPYFSVAFYPEDTSFNALAKTIRSSCRTIELFEIARTVIGKADRFVVVLARKPGASTEAADAVRQPIFLSVPDGLPFETEEAALAHVFANHLGKFFDLAEVEIDPPKGNFLVINKCGVTGELLGPPNYHRYTQIVQQHFASRIARMSLEAFRSRIETIRDPEVVAQWLTKMKKTTRYTWKLGAKSAPPAAVAENSSPATEAVATAEIAAQEGTTTPESSPALTFDAFEDARAYLLANAKDKLVRAIENARFHGKLIETMPAGEIRQAIEGALERQRRFPLDTANALRGRLRREHFTIFKKGSKGVSYVCAVKRKFRVPGQTFADSISALITFIEAHPMVKASELASKFLGLDLPAAAKTGDTAAPMDSPPVTEAVKPEPQLTIEQRAKLTRMQGDLRWLVTEGYVTEFIDGRLFAPPPMVEARKKEVESEEHDPENFPDAPPPDTSGAQAMTAKPVEPAAPVVAAAAIEMAPPPVPAAPLEPAVSAPGESAGSEPGRPSE